MEQNLLLTVERLRLSGDLQRGPASKGAFVIKNIPAQTYLKVSREQGVVLDAFAEEATVPEVFERLLRERRCLPLREFYELVLKAHHEGILCSGPLRRPPCRAWSWPALSLGDRWLWPVAGVLLCAAFVLVWRADVLALPRTTMALLWGGLAAVLSLSAGQALAAALLRGAGGEVYPRRPVESLAALHFRLDLRDARLLRPSEQALIAMCGKLPLAIALIVMAFAQPASLAPLAVAWMIAVRPWGEGLPRRLAGLWSPFAEIATDSDFVFEPNQRPQMHWRPWWRRWDWRTCAAEFVWAAAWPCFAVWLALGALGVNFVEAMAGDAGYWVAAMRFLAAALLLTLGTILIRRWRGGLNQWWRGVRQAWERYWRRRRDHVFPATDAALLRIASGHPLLSLLGPHERTTIVRAWRPGVFSSGQNLFPGAKPGHQVGLILSGQVIATRVTKSGRRARALVLEEGDFFGLPSSGADVGGEASLEFRSATPIAALLMPVEVFRATVCEKLSAQAVYDLTHKFAFLRRLTLCAHWDPPAVARFSRLAQLACYADGERILAKGEDTKWFYIVYDGVAQVRQGPKLLRRLKSGHFFGEISLLQNSAANADVIAQGSMRCLQIDRKSFLRFMTHNHHVALALERISSRRLGHPIFPLKSAPVASAHAFEEKSRRAMILQNT
jgi:CRP-like cAMP-binding protein